MFPNLNVKLETLMTTKVTTVNEFDFMTKVKEIFDDQGFHHVPVVNAENKLLGIISKHDYNKMLNSFSIFENSKSEIVSQKFMQSLLAKDVMTKEVTCLKPSDPLSAALRIFKENLFHALPILGEDNQILGILSTYDLLNYAYDQEGIVEA